MYSEMDATATVGVCSAAVFSKTKGCMTDCKICSFGDSAGKVFS